MRVLFATSEVAPLIKTGGLADVSAALPAALREMDVDVRILMPAYPQVLKSLPHLQVVAEFLALPNFPPARLLAASLPAGVPLLIIECPALYQRGGGAYQNEVGLDWPDNALRFGLLSKIAAILGSETSPLDWKPDVIHCNDWQTGLAPAYLSFSRQRTPCLMTVHNIAFQGLFPASTTAMLGLPDECFKPEGVEYFGSLSFMKAGLFYADSITTVSPTYAKEIQTTEFGFGLEGLLSHRRKDLVGIMNGIDTREWDPAADVHLVQAYSVGELGGKAANKRVLQNLMGLHMHAHIPLLGLVSRFTRQKGLDVVLEAAEQLIELPVQLVLLGSGEADLEREALDLARRYPRQIAAFVGFEESLAHIIEAGADIFLMPSRFEPCGLSQMYSQRYGTPPVVHATGGLIDSVVNCTKATLERGTASGFTFKALEVPGLISAVRRALDVYHNKRTWRSLQRNCMGKDFSWQKSASAYRALYARLLRQ